MPSARSSKQTQQHKQRRQREKERERRRRRAAYDSESDSSEEEWQPWMDEGRRNRSKKRYSQLLHIICYRAVYVGATFIGLNGFGRTVYLNKWVWSFRRQQ